MCGFWKVLAIRRVIGDDRYMVYAQSVQPLVVYPVRAMDERTVDTPATKSEPASAPEELPGTRARERATPEGDGLDPTRYGDWEKNGRCIDF